MFIGYVMNTLITEKIRVLNYEYFGIFTATRCVWCYMLNTKLGNKLEFMEHNESAVIFEVCEITVSNTLFAKKFVS